MPTIKIHNNRRTVRTAEETATRGNNGRIEPWHFREVIATIIIMVAIVDIKVLILGFDYPEAVFCLSKSLTFLHPSVNVGNNFTEIRNGERK